MRNSLVKIENEVTESQLKLEGQLLDARSKVATTEMTGASWLQRNWRPITMLTFLVLIVLDALELLPGTK